MPKISVIVPVYKVEKYLDRCVESILAQTFTDFELILIDDGSPDNCPAMCDEWAKKDERIRVIHQKNGGLSAARNAGIDWVFSNSDSEWITFIDSDDWVHCEMIERLYNAVIDYKVNVSVCGFVFTDGNEETIIVNPIQPKIISPEDFYIENGTNCIVAWGKLYKKKLYSNIRYPIGKLHEDEFTTYRILFKEKEVALIDAPLYMYFQNQNGIMNSKWNVRRLHLLDALNDQSDFFMTNNFSRAQKLVEAIFLSRFKQQMSYLNVSDIKSKKKKQLQRNYAILLSKFLKKRKHIYTIYSHPWHYNAAFPIRMYLYWTFKGIFEKFRKGK